MLVTKLILQFDRSFSGRGHKQFCWLLGLVFITTSTFYILAELIDFNSSAATSCCGDDENNLYRLILTIFVDPGTINEIAVSDRWYALIVAIFGLIIFTGILISIISNMLERRIERYREGDIRYSLSNHVVIIGFNRLGPSIVTQICRNTRYDKCFILVQSVSPTPEIRTKLHELLTPEEEKRIVIFHARRNSDEELALLNTTKARELFILGEDNNEQGHDFINIDCLKRIVKIHRSKGENKKEPLLSSVMFENQSTFSVFQLNDISKDWRGYINFHPINYHEEWAKRIIVSRRYEHEDERIVYPPLDREGINYESDKYVHFVIMGMSRMGTALGVEAAHVMHFPNFNRDKTKKTKITFISDDAEKEMNFFVGRYSHFFEIAPYYYVNLIDGKKDSNTSSKASKDIIQAFEEKKQKLGQYVFKNDGDFLDIEFTFIKGDTESEQVRNLLTAWAKDQEQIMTIAVCLSDPPASIAMGLYLPDIIYRNKIPVFIRQRTSGTLLNIVRNTPNDGKWNKYANAYPIGMLYSCYDLDHKGKSYAMGIKYLYHHQNIYNSPPATIPSEQELEELWNDEATALQWSNYYSSYSIGPKLRSLGISEEGFCPELTNEQIDLIAQVEHNRWNVEKLLIGYRKPTKKEEETTKRNDLKNAYAHPDIKPYNELSDGSKDYDCAITKGLPLLINRFRNRL